MRWVFQTPTRSIEPPRLIRDALTAALACLEWESLTRQRAVDGAKCKIAFAFGQVRRFLCATLSIWPSSGALGPAVVR